jgi:hypothetical protein
MHGGWGAYLDSALREERGKAAVARFSRGQIRQGRVEPRFLLLRLR